VRISKITRRWVLLLLLALLLAAAAAGAWLLHRSGLPDGLPAALPEPLRALLSDDTLPEGFAGSNGRIEATEVDVATKLAGRLTEVLLQEGDKAEAGQIVARLDTDSLQAQSRQAEAELKRARQEREHALAVVEQRDSELSFARRDLKRLQQLDQRERFVSEEQLDRARTRERTSEAALRAAKIQTVASEAAAEAARASLERIGVDLADSALRAPRSGRVLYRLAEPGEVLGVGGKVLTLLDLTDVYMVIFLPETVVGRIALGAEARIVLDAAPEYVVPARVSFVAARAQFTPKQVETLEAREKLSFRVKLRIDPELLKHYEPLVKTGVPGMGYVRLDPEAAWPAHLQPKLPPWRRPARPPSSD
jgi:HlyD family secretion protein